jgi:hypothetical protein
MMCDMSKMLGLKRASSASKLVQLFSRGILLIFVELTFLAEFKRKYVATICRPCSQVSHIHDL